MLTTASVNIHNNTLREIGKFISFAYFGISVTFEMREPNTEKSIFRLIMIAVSQHLLNERVKGKVAERQREREE